MATILLIGLPVALGGLLATSDLCEGRYSDFDNVIETLVVDCINSREDVDTRVNWLGGIGAAAFFIGSVFAALGIAGAIRIRRAAILAAVCLAICFMSALIWLS